jgi:hypothetical protein
VGKAELESSLSTLDIWLIGFGVFVAIGVVGESVAGFLHWRRSGQLQALQTAENLAQQKDIERLSGEAEAARGQIANATKVAATATQRAADANVRAEQLEKENLEIRQKVAGRRISKEQHDVLVNILSGQPSTFDVDSFNDGETGLFASDILKTLTDAGWTVRGKYFPLAMSWQGLNVSQSTNPASVRLLEAFQAAGLPVSWFTEKGQGDVPTIWIGGKPSRFLS